MATINNAAKLATIKLEIIHRQLTKAMEEKNFILCVRLEAQIFIIEELYLSLLKLEKL